MATVVLTAADPPPPSVRGGAVAVGNFDGVHCGHAALVAELRAQADRVAGPAVAVTFDPHPIALLAPDKLQPPLTTLADRAELLHAAGADHVVILRTTPELLRLTPGEFLDIVLGEQLAVKAVVEGFNFRFGRGRAGDLALLGEWCRRHGVGFAVVGRQSVDCAVVSSSRVRTALEAGDVAAAAGLLGRPYRLRGVVGAGAKRGRTIGFPTANLTQPATLVPGDGVYAVRAVVDDGGVWPGAANVGPNPTFGEQARKVEVHLIGYDGDLYGRPLAVDFVARLRDTRPFAGPDELVAQLRADVAAARRLL
ncbi:MAG TPA: bifunctional riboflavin kinase/FAD synthetase [Gemmataceae bacterium]|jgi:riboflavin kinase/FMN adenylyltransferase